MPLLIRHFDPYVISHNTQPWAVYFSENFDNSNKNTVKSTIYLVSEMPLRKISYNVGKIQQNNSGIVLSTLKFSKPTFDKK